MDTTEITSIASLSADVAWSLLTPEEQRLVLEYLEKVRERYLKEKTHTEQTLYVKSQNAERRK